jgi:nucleotide-binding universal stress UspA family protein
MTNSFRKILVATDGSEASLKAARLAVSLAAGQRAEMVVVHVVDDETVREFCRALGKDEKEARQTMVESARKYVAEIEKLAQQSSVRAEGHVEHGTPHEAILKLADRAKADLVVMGKIGRRGVRRALVGSVTRRVIDLTDVPVLVVK